MVQYRNKLWTRVLGDGTSIVACILLVVWLFAAQGQTQGIESEEATVRVNGIELFYRIVGNGRPLLLVHGFNSTGRMWNPYIQQLSANHQLIIPDMRGHGRSTNPSGKFRHRDAAQDLNELLKHLGLTDVRAIGWSSGAIAILELAILDPSRLDAIVIVDGAHRFPEETRAILKAADPDEWVANAPWYWNEVLTWHPGGLEQLHDLGAQVRSFGADPDEGRRTSADLRKVNVPTLIAHGDRDDVYPVELAVEMHAALPFSELWIMPGVGHEAVFVYQLEPADIRCSACEKASEVFVEVVTGFFERANK